MKLGRLHIAWDRSRRQKQQSLLAASDRGWVRIFDSWPGAWQQDVRLTSSECVLANSTVFACVGLISSDIAKLNIKLLRREVDTWHEQQMSWPLPVLRNPNRFQTAPQFLENWLSSRLLHGNTYVLKQRDRDGKIVALYVLDPQRVTPLVASDGGVYYRLADDTLAQIESSVVVPSSEIIHDRCNALFHPLIGVSPITACVWSATVATRIARNSKAFFENMSRPGGVLTAPGTIPKETADRLKAAFQENFSGANSGKVAVLGDGLKYESTGVNAVDAQLIEQLKWTAEDVARAFRVPAFMVGAGAPPPGLTVESLVQLYYSQVLQSAIESIERALDAGLELPDELRTEFDLEALLRMDSASRYKAYADAVGGGWMTPNEARRKEGLAPVAGGDSCYLQQQNFSLEALAKRDDRQDPFAPTGATGSSSGK